ncbi:hypothetical protein ACXVWQ_10860, partial [Haemophilus sp. SZY H57]
MLYLCLFAHACGENGGLTQAPVHCGTRCVPEDVTGVGGRIECAAWCWYPMFGAARGGCDVSRG